MPFDIIVGRNEADKKKFGNKGTILLGRNYVKMGQTTSLSNYVYLDVIRSHVVFVVGKRGGGKCVTGETLITLEDGSQVPIQELADKDLKILGLNDKLKVTKLDKKDFFRRKVDKIVHLKLRSGKEIKLTPEHPLLTVKGWVPVKDIGIGGRIATPRKLEIFGNSGLEDFKVKILAYLIAEGHTRKSWVLFSNSDFELINEFEDSISQFDPSLVVTEHSKPGCYRVSNADNRYGFKTNPVKKWLQDLGIYGEYAKEKWLPSEVIELPKEKLALFLNRLFSCDGSVYLDKSKSWEISYSSSSEKLIKQVHHLLLRFSILSKLRTKKIKYKGEYVKSFELVLNRKNCVNFIEQIGFFGNKREISKRCLKEIINVPRNPNVDTIPKAIWDIYRPESWADLGRKVGYAHPKAMRERIRYSPSRQTMLQIALVEENVTLMQLARSDIFWDEISSMEIVEGEVEVFDISVPNFHNFVANDILVHNSYSSSVIAEGMVDLPDEVSKNLAIIMLDTMGIYWTMKYPNEKDLDLLEMWDLKPKGLKKINIFTPIGQFEKAKSIGIPTDYPFSIKASELTGEDWRLAFELPSSHSVSILIEKTLGDLAEERIFEFDIEDIIERMDKDKSFPDMVRNEAVNRFKTARRWGLFSKEGTKIDVLIKGGMVSVLDVSAYATSEGGWGVKSLVVGLICKRVFIERMVSRQLEEIEAIKTGYSYFKMDEETQSKDKKPLVWFILDEAHEMLPREGKTAATDALVTILREGRQPGLSLLLITQQPGKIHSDVLTQADIVLAHRLTARRDVDALNSMMQSYLGDTLTGYLNMLPSEKGAAIILDDNSERLYPMRVRPKFSWHGGEAPTALKYKRSMNLGL
jgi:uncharacterized protein